MMTKVAVAFLCIVAAMWMLYRAMRYRDLAFLVGATAPLGFAILLAVSL